MKLYYQLFVFTTLFLLWNSPRQDGNVGGGTGCLYSSESLRLYAAA